MDFQRRLVDMHETRHIGVMTWCHPGGYYETVCLEICPISGRPIPGDAIHRATTRTKEAALKAHGVMLEAARRSEVLEPRMTLPTEH